MRQATRAHTYNENLKTKNPHLEKQPEENPEDVEQTNLQPRPNSIEYHRQHNPLWRPQTTPSPNT